MAPTLSKFFQEVATRRERDDRLAFPDKIMSANLSPRQVECLQRIALGQTSAEIGAAMGLSKRTVDHYATLICAKLGVRTRVEAVSLATAMRIIDPPESSRRRL